jgi:thermitase
MHPLISVTILLLLFIQAPCFAYDTEKIKNFNFQEYTKKKSSKIQTKKFNCKDNSDDYIPGQVVVKYKDYKQALSSNHTRFRLNSLSVNFTETKEFFPEEILNNSKMNQQRLARAKSLRARHELDKIYIAKYQAEKDDCKRLENLIKVLEQDPNIEYAEPSVKYKPLQITNDPLFNSGSGHQGLWNLKKVQASDAWRFSRGRGVNVAVIDGSTDTSHPDLVSNVGRTDFNLIPGYYQLPSFHGTHVSGTIAATGNNNRGIVGIAYESKINPIGMFDPIEERQVILLSQALNEAFQLNSDVVNMSISSSSYSSSDHAIFDYLYDLGIVCIAAAGNYASSSFEFPAAYGSVLAVANTDINDRRNPSSQYGTWIDVAAPGTNILSLTSVGTNCNLIQGTCSFPPSTVAVDDSTYGYALSGGTSMAAPLVSGIAALVKSYWNNLSLNEIYASIIYGTDSINTDRPIGTGRVNAAKAIYIAMFFKINSFLDPNKDGVYTDSELVDFVNKEIQAKTRYSSEFDMNNDGVINKIDFDLVDIVIQAFLPELMPRINKIRQDLSPDNNNDSGAGQVTDVNSDDPIIKSASLIDSFSGSNQVTHRGRTIVHFSVESSGLFGLQDYIPSAVNLSLGGLPVLEIPGRVGEFLGIIDFSSPSANLLRSEASGVISTVNLNLSTVKPRGKGRPVLRALNNNPKGRLVLNGNRLRRNGSFKFIFEDGSHEEVNFRFVNPRRKVSRDFMQVPENAVFGLYSVRGFGSEILAY